MNKFIFSLLVLLAGSYAYSADVRSPRLPTMNSNVNLGVGYSTGTSHDGAGVVIFSTSAGYIQAIMVSSPGISSVSSFFDSSMGDTSSPRIFEAALTSVFGNWDGKPWAGMTPVYVSSGVTCQFTGTVSPKITVIFRSVTR